MPRVCWGGNMFEEEGALKGLDPACPLCAWDMSVVAPFYTLRLSPPPRPPTRQESSVEAPLNDF